MIWLPLLIWIPIVILHNVFFYNRPINLKNSIKNMFGINGISCFKIGILLNFPYNQCACSKKSSVTSDSIHIRIFYPKDALWIKKIMYYDLEYKCQKPLFSIYVQIVIKFKL